jgi:hypothetical protein
MQMKWTGIVNGLCISSLVATFAGLLYTLAVTW